MLKFFDTCMKYEMKFDPNLGIGAHHSAMRDWWSESTVTYHIQVMNALVE
jgi:hypothetical protein